MVSKPNAFLYHLCQTSSTINPKRIRWHYEPSTDAETSCQNRLTNSECFEFYSGTSTSLLVVKEPDVYPGKYTCRVRLNATAELRSVAWIDVKLPVMENDEQFAGRLAMEHRVPYIVDENEPTSFGRRVPLGGLFHTRCQSVASSSSLNFTWLQLRNKSKEKMKNMRVIEDDGKRIRIQQQSHTSECRRNTSL